MTHAWWWADEPVAAAATARALTALGHRCHVMPERPEALAGWAAGRPAPDVVVLAAAAERDATTELVRALRGLDGGDATPIVLAVGGAPANEGVGNALRAGVDELATGPPGDDLALRIALAQERRASRRDGADRIVVGDLEVDRRARDARVAGRSLDLTRIEFELLWFLAAHPGTAFGRDALLRRVWGYDDYGRTRTVDVHVRRVREKLGPAHAARLRGIRSVGYRFDR